MDLSIFLAKVLGYCFVIFSLCYFFRIDFLEKAVDDFYKNSGLVLLGSFISIINDGVKPPPLGVGI